MIEDGLKRFFFRILKFFIQPCQFFPFDTKSIESILIIRQHDQLGDMLCVVPLLRRLKELFPEAHVTLIASPVNYEIMRYHPYLDLVINYDKQKFYRSIESFNNFLQSFRARKYDIAIVPGTVSVSATSDLMALFSRAKIRIGARSLMGRENQSSFCFTHPVDLDWTDEPHRHQSLRNLDILKIFDSEQLDLSGKIGITEDEASKARTTLVQFRKLNPLIVGIHPGAGKPENRWSPQCFAEIANALATKQNAFIVITEGPMDEEQVEKLKQHLKCGYFVLKNSSIRAVAAVINELDIFISNDTGVMHVAAATKTPLLALFGPTDPLQWASQKQGDKYISAQDGNIHSIKVEQVKKIAFEMIEENISKKTEKQVY